MLFIGKVVDYYMPEGLLKKELETFNKNKEKPVETDLGRYALVKDSRVIGCFDTENDAIKIGLERFGNVPFLVKKIEQVEQTHNFTSNLIGV